MQRSVERSFARPRPELLLGGVMVRLDLSYFYRLGEVFVSLRAVGEDIEMLEVWSKLYAGQEALRTLYNDPTVQHALRSSRVRADELHEVLNRFTSREFSEEFSRFDKANLIGKLDAFEVVLQSDLAVADGYFVTDKAPYNALSLISNGATLFPESTVSKVPIAMQDLENAGRCLAFELSTAAGFHIMRALEAVVRRYWEAVTNNAPHPKHRSLGVYLRGMEKLGCGDAKIIATLSQIKDLHRNEISHPDANLSFEEAVSLIGIARSAAAAMLVVIPEPPFELTAPEPEPALLPS